VEVGPYTLPFGSAWREGRGGEGRGEVGVGSEYCGGNWWEAVTCWTLDSSVIGCWGLDISRVLRGYRRVGARLLRHEQREEMQQ
jgi:hypothetical protein